MRIKNNHHYEILSHTANLKIRVWGKDKKDLFLNALLSLMESIKPKAIKSEKREQSINIKSEDLETLLVDFLNEVIYLSQSNQEAYSKIEFHNFSDKSLKGKLIGTQAESFGEEVKAATYHNLRVQKKDDNLWEAIILFDV